VSVVDHTTKGMLLGRGGEEPWLPFLAVGWFNSAYTYPHQVSGGSSGGGSSGGGGLQVQSVF
jgi:hypothetical protein